MKEGFFEGVRTVVSLAGNSGSIVPAEVETDDPVRPYIARHASGARLSNHGFPYICPALRVGTHVARIHDPPFRFYESNLAQRNRPTRAWGPLSLNSAPSSLLCCQRANPMTPTTKSIFKQLRDSG